jgi:hypothetical protein
MTTTHLSTTVVETHKDQETGTLVVGRACLRRPAETERLRQLHADLPGDRDFVVERGVIVTSAGSEKRGTPRRVEVRAFPVLAVSGAEAARLANEAKFAAEFKIGHHQ